jgi:hypothetical protein
MAERASSFGDLSDLSDFKATKPAAVPNREEVTAVAERGDFVSREPKKKTEKPRQRRYRTGRTVQIPCRVTPSVMQEINRLTDEHFDVMGVTIERAIAALKRELAGQGRAKTAARGEPVDSD